jgi:hypothetical protein
MSMLEEATYIIIHKRLMSMLEVVTDINTQNANVHAGSKKNSQAWNSLML